MKKILMLMIFLSFKSIAQKTEFKVYENGLIYSEQSVTKLKHVVDSLNLKFRTCEFNKTFLSSAQAKANYIRIENAHVLEAKKDLENNISYADFKAKYPKASFDENLVVIKSFYKNYNNLQSVYFSSLELGNTEKNEINLTEKDINFSMKNFKGKWLFKFSEKTSYSNVSLSAFYFIEDFTSKPIIDKYARLIQYSNCLIDTTAQIFSDDAKETGIRFQNKNQNKAKLFEKYVNDALKKPSFDYERFSDEFFINKKNKKKTKIDIEREKLTEIEFANFQKKSEKWEELRLSRLDSLKKADSNFMRMLKEALTEAKVDKSSDTEFEEYVGLYISKEEELELKRNRRVIGGCSQDDSPRIHALNIAMLSAETTKWEIFLRSHLNIMNDRFDRVSDGSYAQAQRNTYVKEIEVLDINVLDLILGISLRIENPSKNHYYSSINRVGRALSETKNPELVETSLLNMISDSELDDFNRVLMYYLFENYNHFLINENQKKQNQSKLEKAVSFLPDYISSRILKK